MRAVSQAGSAHAAAGSRIAANATAFARELAACALAANDPAPQYPWPFPSHAAVASIVLLPILQHSARPGASHLALVPQLELIKLEMQRLSVHPDAVVPLVAAAATAPGPAYNAPAQDTCRWYTLQQSLLCALQARSL